MEKKGRKSGVKVWIPEIPEDKERRRKEGLKQEKKASSR